MKCVSHRFIKGLLYSYIMSDFKRNGDRRSPRSFGGGRFGRDSGESSGGFGGRSGGRFGGRSGGRFGRDSGRSSREPPEMHDVVCDKCGKNCTVPFKPTSSKPVYCSDCFKTIEPSRKGPGSGCSEEDIAKINQKLDKIMLALKIE